MSDFDTILGSVSGVWLDELGGESIVYKPKGGTARTIRALVSRQPDQTAPEAQQMRRPVIEVEVANHPTTGIDAADAGLIGGTITLAIRRGGEATAIVIQAPNPIGTDAGMVRLKL